MRLSGIPKGIRAFLDTLGDAGGLVRVLDVFRGGEPTVAGEKPTWSESLGKIFYGVLGKSDEREMAGLLEKLNKEWQEDLRPEAVKGPNPKDVIIGFLVWHFKTENLPQKVLAWWYGNGFRSFVTKMKTTEKQETTTENKDPKGKTVITKTVVSKDSDQPALDFLKMMVRTIVSEGEGKRKPKYLKGYQKLLAEFRALGYPNIPEDADEDFLRIASASERSARVVTVMGTRRIRGTARDLRALNQRREAESNANWLRRLYRKI